MAREPKEFKKKRSAESDRVEAAAGTGPDQIEIEVSDPAITEDFDEADFDHEFDDDFEEEIDGEYELEDDQYGEDFRKEFGHLTDDDGDVDVDADLAEDED